MVFIERLGTCVASLCNQVMFAHPKSPCFLCRLTDLVGADHALDFLETSREISAQEALSTGLATRIEEQATWDELIAQLVRFKKVIVSCVCLIRMFALTFGSSARHTLTPGAGQHGPSRGREANAFIVD